MFRYRDLDSKEESEMSYLLDLNLSITALETVKVAIKNSIVDSLVTKSVGLIKQSNLDEAKICLTELVSFLKDVDPIIHGAVSGALDKVTRAHGTDIACDILGLDTQENSELVNKDRITLEAVKKFAEIRGKESLKFIRSIEGNYYLVPDILDIPVKNISANDINGLVCEEQVRAIILSEELSYTDAFSVHDVRNGHLVLYEDKAEDENGYNKFTHEEIEELLSYSKQH